MDKIEEALLPFAIIGSEMHDTSFTVRIVDKEQHEIGRVDENDFRKAYEVLLDIKAGMPINTMIASASPRQYDHWKDIVYWCVLAWAFAATILLIGV